MPLTPQVPEGELGPFFWGGRMICVVLEPGVGLGLSDEGWMDMDPSSRRAISWPRIQFQRAVGVLFLVWFVLQAHLAQQ